MGTSEKRRTGRVQQASERKKSKIPTSRESFEELGSTKSGGCGELGMASDNRNDSWDRTCHGPDTPWADHKACWQAGHQEELLEIWRERDDYDWDKKDSQMARFAPLGLLVADRVGNSGHASREGILDAYQRSVDDTCGLSGRCLPAVPMGY